MAQCLDRINEIVWGAPALVLILLTGLLLSIRTGFAQLRLFPRSLRLFVARLHSGGDREGISPFRALCTALAATVGTGNLVGVAGAIALGGPGSIFWMWVCALLGMVTKFAEATLAVHYRVQSGPEALGGTMYIISRGLGKKWRWLASCYCLFGLFAAFGVGNATQINAVITGLNQLLGPGSLKRDLAFGLLLAALLAPLLLGGARRIGAAAELLVPFVSGVYILLCAGVLILRASQIPAALASIFQGAFSPRAVTGGAIGSAFQVLRVGVSRGVFTNEAGMGTASMAHAGANVDHPVEQGLMGIVEVFLDTVVICTLTALVILVSGIPVPYGTDAGAVLTDSAFCAVYGDWVTVFLTAALGCFALATVLGWGLYGGRCAEYLFGPRAWSWFSLAQAGMAVVGAVADTGMIWSLAEILNGLMAIPNLITLVLLSSKLRELTCEYKLFSGGASAKGGTYENLDQCKPLRTLSHAEIPPSGCGSQE